MVNTNPPTLLRIGGNSVKDYRNGMSTQEYRASFPYRKEYFKQNPGLFNCIWFCSQCGKPLFGRKNVQVDHIVPLNKGGENAVRNCTAICRKCNAAKSDKDDRILIARGKRFKFFERNASRLNKGLGAVLMTSVAASSMAVNTTEKVVGGTAKVATKAGKGVLRVGCKTAWKAMKTCLKALTLPLRKGTLMSRLISLAVYAFGIYYLLSRYTSVLDAWIY